MNNAIKLKTDIEMIFSARLFGLLGAVLSFFSLIFIAFSGVESEFFAIIVLPITMLVISCMVFEFQLFFGIGSLCIFATYLLRFAVGPVILILGDFRCDFDRSLYLDYFSTACYLMAYEGIAVYIFLTMLTKVFKKKLSVSQGKSLYNDNSLEQKEKQSFKFGKFFNFILILFVLIVVVCFIVYPQFVKYFKIMLLDDDTEAFTRYTELVESVPGVVFYPFKLCIEFLKIFLPLRIAMWIFNQKRLGEDIKIFLNFLLIGLSFFIMTQEQINSLFCCVILFLYMIIKSVKFKQILVVAGVGAVVVAGVLFIFKIADVGDLKGFARIINNYFAGPQNLSAALAMRDIAPATAELLKGDIVSNVVYLELFMDTALDNSNLLFNQIIGNRFSSAIMPLLGQGCYYFGLLLGILPSLFVMSYTLLLDYLSQKNKGNIYQLAFALTTIFSGMTIGMYNINIFVANFCYQGIIVAVAYIADRIFSNNSRRGQPVATTPTKEG
ncbi:MAG: hypothetical protein ACI4MY_05115 [Christensenellales bacterium]